jgi:hypothetical protein
VANFAPAVRTGPEDYGMDPKLFIEEWRQFSFHATDNKTTYRFDINENAFMPYFRGRVGPRVSPKPDDEK